jgi:membrane-associated protease RseP (regulator of RpoE activity)
MLVLTLLTICALYALATFLFTAAIALGGRSSVVDVKRYNLFIGPRLWSGQVAGIPVTIRAIPVSGYVEFCHREEEAGEAPHAVASPDETILDRSGPARRWFDDLHPIRRAAVALSGSACLLLVAVLCLGPARAWPAFLRGFVQAPAAAVAPLSTGKQLVGRLTEVVSTMPLAVALGLVFTKVAALNLLPLPGLTGGEILLTLLRWKRPGPLPAEGGVRCLGLLLLLALFSSLLLAVLAYLYSIQF